MTDNEIVKALECCVEYDCRVCRYDVNSAICISNLMKDTLDLINRQKAEIERLQKYNTDVAFKHYNDGIKEFAERLKADYKNKCMGLSFERCIDNLVKEMVGDME